MSAESQFTALVLKQNEVGEVTSRIQTLDNNTLPEGDVTVSIKYSALNYKDGLIIRGLGRLVRDYPHVPGIDFAGVIEQSESPDYMPGDEVVLTGWQVGEAHWGGHATRARVKSDWLVPLPEGLTLKQSMSIATAGLTAMLAIMTLEEHGLTSDDEGEVLVSVLVDENGEVADVELIKEIPRSRLNAATVAAARRWTYEPAMKDGVAVSVWKTERIVFTLD